MTDTACSVRLTPCRNTAASTPTRPQESHLVAVAQQTRPCHAEARCRAATHDPMSSVATCAQHGAPRSQTDNAWHYTAEPTTSNTPNNRTLQSTAATAGRGVCFIAIISHKRLLVTTKHCTFLKVNTRTRRGLFPSCPPRTQALCAGQARCHISLHGLPLPAHS